MQPDTQYAKSGDVHIAYQAFGEGPINLVMVPGFVSNVEAYWEQPDFARFLNRLASYARVVTFDKRGTGSSDRVAELPGLDARMDDLRAVMDAAGMEQAALLGISEGAPLSVLVCGDLSRSLPGARALRQLFPLFLLVSDRGGARKLLWLCRDVLGHRRQRADDSRPRALMTLLSSAGGAATSVSARALPRVTALMRMNSQIDISGILPAVRVPTLVIHRTGDQAVSVEGGRDVAAHIPGARCSSFQVTTIFSTSATTPTRSPMRSRNFSPDRRRRIEADRVLATVLFTDIVGSTEKAAALGDQRWRHLLDDHHATIRRVLARFRGREVKTTGDGFLATFDGPARGVRCACAIAEEIKPLGIEVRAGLHTGECEMMGDDVGGIAVHIGARVAALAGAGEVLVSSTVKDLVAGSGLRFGARGSQTLKGIPGEWQIFAADR